MQKLTLVPFYNCKSDCEKAIISYPFAQFKQNSLFRQVSVYFNDLNNSLYQLNEPSSEITSASKFALKNTTRFEGKSEGSEII